MDLPPVLVPLRGDFFCMPFGSNAQPFAGENHPLHGETAGKRWAFDRIECTTEAVELVLKLKTTVRPGQVTKRIRLLRGQNAIYSEHVLEGYCSPMPLGHHPTLRLPEAEGAVHVTTSACRFGQTHPGMVCNPAEGNYQALAPGQRFEDLRHVPLMWREPATGDCTRHPCRAGYTDVLAVFSQSRAQLGGHPAWVAAVNTAEGYLWYSLRDPDLLPSTVVWMCNRGRHTAPWNGRNRCLGLEAVCAYFTEGLAASAQPNSLTKEGLATAVALNPDRPLSVKFIQGLVRVPPEFDRVEAVEFLPGKAVFVSPEGRRVTATVDHGFVF